MSDNSNCSGGATSAPAALGSVPHAPDPRARVKSAKVDTMTIDNLVSGLAKRAAMDNDPQSYLEALLDLAHTLVYVLEAEDELINLPPSIGGSPRPAERPTCPPWLPPFPSLEALSRLDREEQVRLLDKRASELMREIEGLRPALWGARGGYYVAPPYRDDYRMIEQARRRFRRLRDTAMKLGHWTDGRWDAGEEETHLV